MEILQHIGSAKSAEYILALVGLFSYMAFWRVLNGPAVRVPAIKEAYARLSDLVAGFLVPKDVLYHPGHAWARVGDDGAFTVGIDDFAGKLLGKFDSVSLPVEGNELKQGAKGWTLLSDGKAIDMLAPVGGKVVAVNKEIAASPSTAIKDPYGAGWFLKIKPASPTTALKNLIPSNMATEWFENIRDSLSRRRMAPALSVMYQDGGFPVDGIAKVLDPQHWDDIAREYFLTRE